jgi:hypothetical protein
MKKPKNAAAEAGPVNRPLSMKERARKARHEVAGNRRHGQRFGGVPAFYVRNAA